MLPFLLATHPQTSGEVLAALASWADADSDTVAAALTHPRMPVDVDGPIAAVMTARAAHDVLVCPRTTAVRRARVLAALGSSGVEHLIGEYTDLSERELTDLLGDQAFAIIARSSSFATAVARNPASPSRYVTDALRTLARTPTIHPLSVALLAHQRDASDVLIAELCTILNDRLVGSVDHYFTTSAPLEQALNSERRLRLTVFKQTGSAALALRIVDAHPEDASLLRAYLPGNHPHHDLRAALDAADPPGARRDESTLNALESADRVGASTSLELLLNDPTLTTATLRTVYDTLVTDLRNPNFNRYQCLLQVAAHPACPTDLLPAIDGHTRRTPAPEPGVAWRGEVVTHHLARAIMAGDPHPGLAVPADLLSLDGVEEDTVNHRRICADLDAHPRWPLPLDAATALLAIAGTSTGTLGELLETTDAITT